MSEPKTGVCFIVRRTTPPKKGWRPVEDRYYGPWRREECVVAFTEGERDSLFNSEHVYEIIADVPYEIAGRFVILKGRYAVDRGFVDGPDAMVSYPGEIPQYATLADYR